MTMSTPKEIYIGVAQIECQLMRPRANMRRARSMVLEAAAKGADLVCLPEAFVTSSNYVELDEVAETTRGSIAEWLADLAQEAKVHLVAGLLEKDGAKHYSSALLFSPNGELIGVYRRSHIVGIELRYLDRGLEYPVFETDIGRIGILIGYDIYFPEAVRMLSMQNADYIVIPGLLPQRFLEETQQMLKARAMENGIAVVLCSGSGENHMAGFTYMGHSTGVIDAIFLSDHQFDYLQGDEVLGKVENSTDSMIITVPLAALRKHRKRHPLLQDIVPSIYSQYQANPTCVS